MLRGKSPLARVSGGGFLMSQPPLTQTARVEKNCYLSGLFVTHPLRLISSRSLSDQTYSAEEMISVF